MIYFPEEYYFSDQKDFPFEKAVLITTKKLSEWCTHYKAELVSPRKGVKDRKREGELPLSIEEKHQFIDSLITWLFFNSEIQVLFTLFLDDSKVIEQRERPRIFDHHDDTCCWTLNLTSEQFEELKNTLKDNGLPEDLFYPEDKTIKIIKPAGIIARFFNKFGFTSQSSRIYSPKRWEKIMEEKSEM